MVELAESAPVNIFLQWIKINQTSKQLCSSVWLQERKNGKFVVQSSDRCILFWLIHSMLGKENMVKLGSKGTSLLYMFGSIGTNWDYSKPVSDTVKGRVHQLDMKYKSKSLVVAFQMHLVLSPLEVKVEQCSEIWALLRPKPTFLWNYQFELIFCARLLKTNRFSIF